MPNGPELTPEPRPEAPRPERIPVQTAASIVPDFPTLDAPIRVLKGPEVLSDDQVLENLLTLDYQGVSFKRACLLRVLSDHGLQARLLEKLQGEVKGARS